MIERGSVAVAGALALLLSPLPARAGKPSAAAIALATPGAPTGEVARLQALATAALFRSPRLAGVDAAGRADAAGEAAREAARRQGAEKQKEARAAFDSLDLAAASRLFGEAAEAYRKGDLRRELLAYADALIWQAGSAWVNGDKDGASAELQEIYAYAPGAQIDKSAFPPDLVAAASQIRADTAESSERLSVETTPVALVWVDGRLVGPSPVTATVPSGHHFVVASAPGYGLATLRTEGSHAALALAPAPDAAWLAGEEGRLAGLLETPERTAVVRALADRLGVDELFVVAREPAAFVAIRFAQDGHVLAYEREPIAAGRPAEANAPAPPALPALIDRALEHDLPRGSNGAPVADTGLPKAGLSLGRPELAVGLGGLGVVLLGVGTVFGALAAGDHGALAGTPQTNVAGSQALAASGSARALLSDVFDLVGVAALGGAAVVWYWPEISGPKKSVELTGVSVVPVLGPGGAGFALSGGF